MARKLLDTTVTDVGLEAQPKLHRTNGGGKVIGYVQVDLSTGDTVVMYGRVSDSVTEKPLATVTSTTEAPFLVDLPPLYRFERTVDGAVGEAYAEVVETYE